MAYIERRETKSGDTRYRALVRIQGHPSRSATFSTHRKAKRWAAKVETAINEGEHLPSREAKNRTLGEAVERYRVGALGDLVEREQERRLAQLEWWRDYLGNPKLAAVTPARIAEGRDALKAGESPSGREVSNATANRYVAALSSMLGIAAREWGWLRENPCTRVRSLKEPRGRVRYLEPDEREKLMQAAREDEDADVYAFVVLAALTGARQGEIAALTWGDVDFEVKTAVIHESKNDERRSIPVVGPALEVLKERSKVRRIDDDRIFPDGFPREAWNRVRKAAGLEDWTFHDLRHEAASQLAMSGASLAEIAEILGHKTLAMVQRYSHLTEAHTVSVAERMAAKVYGP